MAPYFKKSNPPIPPMLEYFLELLKKHYETPNSSALSIILNCGSVVFTSQYLQLLRQEVVSLQYPSAIRNSVEAILTDDWPGLVETAIAYLEFVAAADISIPSGNDEACLIWFGKLHSFVQALNAAFNSARGAMLSTAVVDAVQNLVHFANYCDRRSRDRFRTQTRAVLNTVVRSFNSSLAERTQVMNDGTVRLAKKAAAIDIANSLFRVYQKIRETRLVKTILDNLSASGIPITPPYFSRSALTKFYYHRGVHELHNTSFLSSHADLTRAFTLCHPTFHLQRRRILIPLLTASLILGHLPRAALFRTLPEAAELEPIFRPLSVAIKTGNFALFLTTIETHAAFLHSQNIHHLLAARCQPLLWRSLFRTIHAITRAPSDPQPTVALSHVLHCARLLHRRDNPLFFGAEEGTRFLGGALEIDADVVEGVALNLLDQGFVKGYLAKRADGEDVLVLAKAGAFPDVAAVWGLPRWRREVEAGGGGGVGAGGGRVMRLKGVKAVGA